MESAAREGESVRAFVSDNQQTAIVTQGAAIRLDWSRWVDEVLGGSVTNATYTVRRTQLDESGNPIGIAVEFEGTDRIVVNFDPEANEYYVQINSVISVTGAEDPDRAIYELEVTTPGSDIRYTSSMTVFALDDMLVVDPLGM